MYKKVIVMSLLAGFVAACEMSGKAGKPDSGNTETPLVVGGTVEKGAHGTCTGTYPSYWQDPKFPEMYQGQLVSNQPTEGYQGRVFKLSDAFPTELIDESAEQPWRDERFDAMFDATTDQQTRSALAMDYSNLVMQYIQAGNIDSGDVATDWDVCNNPVRSWYNIPFQTYNVMAGREFTYGLTREAPVGFSMNTSDAALKGTMWAVAFFNPTAAYTLGTIWKPDGSPDIPTEDVSFEEGAVIGKPLFTTLNSTQMPMLSNIPQWQANISDPVFCGCKTTDGSACTMAQQSQQCPRSLTKWGPVTLLQFDIAVKDARATETQWVFGTFVADGENKANVENPWNRISPLGLMWGNSPPPPGQLASGFPEDPRSNGFDDMIIFWDTVDMLNKNGGTDTFNHPGHLGCNSRLDGPADKAYSSCMSCHGSASVADDNIAVPPIAAQFGGLSSECALQEENGNWIDASGSKAKTVVVAGVDISYTDIDSIYFANTAAGKPFNTTVTGPTGPVNVLDGKPSYADGRKEWVSLDYSLQTSISIVQWKQWMQHASDPQPAHLDVHSARLPRR